LLAKLSDEQLETVATQIDPQFWMRKFKQHPADVELVKQIVRESKI
jgi:mono/diheme cytochrome c family protein